MKLVFQRLQECGLKLAPKKCKFFYRRVAYIGHIVSEKGIEADPSKIEKIKNWPTPITPEQVRQFLGFAGYYMKFVNNFPQISQPLTKLMPPPTMTKRSKKSSASVNWTCEDKENQAFNMLKDLLTSAPILAYLDYSHRVMNFFFLQ